LRSIIEIRWPELNYPNLSEYVTGLVRYDLMLGGPHTYFNATRQGAIPFGFPGY
jgi:hypothetical protein